MGKVAVVTGCSRGLGEAFVKDLLEKDYEVFGVARSKGNDLCPTFISDFSKREDLESFFESPDTQRLWQESHKELILVNNAGSLGVLGTGFTAQSLQSIYQLNVLTPIALMYRVLESKSQNINILNVSSGAAISPYPGWQEYCSTKAALSMASKVCAVDIENGLVAKGKNVKVFEYAPGVVATKMQAQLRDAEKGDFPHRDKFVQLNEEGKLVSPEESAKYGINTLFKLPSSPTYHFDRY